MRLGLGIGLQYGRRAGGGAAAPVGILDSYTGAAFAFAPDVLIYGAHSVTDNAVGSATEGLTGQYTVRVRRSSDNAVSSFTYTEVSDGTLTTWVGTGNDGFVEAGFDQSGNGNHATQSTAANQPKIVDAGSLVVENGKAALDFDGVDDSFLVGSFSWQDISIFCITSSQNYANTTYYTLLSAGYSGNTGFIFRNTGASALYWGTGNMQLAVSGFNNNQPGQASSNPPSNGQHLFSAINNTPRIYEDSVDTTNFSTSASVLSQTEDLFIGVESNARRWLGGIQNVIIYPNNQSSNRTAIEAAINNEYNIY